MRKDKNPALADHFEKLKAILPEVYQPHQVTTSERMNERLIKLLKNSLGIIEAVYLQNPENFTAARVEAYATILAELNELGVAYRGNEDLIDRAAGLVVLQAKMPMERAGRRKSNEGEEKKAI
jgi:hypothetical protein